MSIQTGYEPEVQARLEADAAQIVARYPHARSALLPLLHLVQSEEGFVSRNGITFCAQTLGLSTADVSAVATFYSQYKRRPNGEYTVGVCTNTLCAVMGGDEIFTELSEHLGVGNDETTLDGSITLERVECNAACDYAPVMMVNWEFFDNQTPESAVDVVDRLRAGEDVAPTRGPSTVCTFKQVSRVLAGFEDGRAGEGVAAGAPSLAGLDVAHEHDWQAPPFDGSGAAKPAEETAPAEKTPAAKASTKPAAATTKPAAKTKDAAPETADASQPKPGAEQSSAEREPNGPADTDPDTTSTKSQES